MLIKKPADIRSSEITPPALYKERRRFFKLATLAGATALLTGKLTKQAQADTGNTLDNIQPGPFGTAEKQTPFADVTRYNNFYEFGTDKSDPALYAHTLRTNPWTVNVDGHCEKPGQYALEDFLAPHQFQERGYRLRCVEAWPMVIPWGGHSTSRCA